LKLEAFLRGLRSGIKLGETIEEEEGREGRDEDDIKEGRDEEEDIAE